MNPISIFSKNPSVDDRQNLIRGAGLEICLWVLALLALGHAGWMWADSWLYQRRASTELATTTARQLSAEPVEISPGTPIGRLKIPRLNVSVVVAEGTSERILQRAIGRLRSSAHPGESGNVVLAGHRDTFFRPLDDVRSGDFVVFESASGRDLFEVEWTRVVEPTDIDVTKQTGHPTLTLITCYPFRYIGNAPQRFIVRARHVSGPAQKPRPTQRESSPAS